MCAFFSPLHIFEQNELLPGNPPRLHFVGHSNISGPDVVLPAFLTQDPPQDRPTVHANAHVHVCLGFLPDVPADGVQSVVHESKRSTVNQLMKLHASLHLTTGMGSYFL